MLNTITCNVGVNLAEVLTSQGRKLVPKRNTLLAELVGSMPINSTGQSTDDLKYIVEVASIGERREKVYQQSAHDTYMDNYVGDLATLVSSQVSFARSVVNAEINAFIERVSGGLTSYKYKDPEDFFKVNYYTLNEAFTNDLISSEIKAYGNNPTKYNYEQTNLTKEVIDGLEIQSYIMSGDSEIDGTLTKWLGSIPNEIMMGYLTVIPGTSSELRLPTATAMDYYLLNYLFYRSLAVRADLPVRQSQASIRNVAGINRDYYGLMLHSAIHRYQFGIKSGQIITADSELNFSIYNENGVTITVYEEALQALVDANLGIDVLFGYLSGSSTSSSITTAELIANSDKYLGTWRQTRNLYLAGMSQRKLQAFKLVLDDSIYNFVNKATSEDSDVMRYFSNATYVAETLAGIEEYKKGLTVDDVEKLEVVAMEIIGKFKYRFSNAYYLLKEMKSIMELNDSVTPMEAALFATINLVTDHLVEQLDVV